MDLKKYFGNKKGLGVLSTADEKGKVNAAVYSKAPRDRRQTRCLYHGGQTHSRQHEQESLAISCLRKRGPVIKVSVVS